MKANRLLETYLASVLVLAVVIPSHAAELGTHFTYQGRLVQNGVPIGNSSPVVCDMTFGLWDAATLGNQLGLSPIGPLTISVDQGLFNVNLSFGPGAINGQARWLEITVDCPGDAMSTTLTPRQQLRPAPHALALPGLYTIQDAFSPNLIGGKHENAVTPGVSGATIGGGGASAPDNNRVTDTYGTVGGGCSNRAGNDAGTVFDTEFATVAGGFRNVAAGDYSAIPGGDLNLAGGDYSFAAGRRAKVRDTTQSADTNGDEGTFVWADSTNADFTSTGPNQFLIRASNGVGINTNKPEAALHVSGNQDDDYIYIVNDQYGLTLAPTFLGRRARETRDAPEPVQQGDGLASFSSAGYDGDGFGSGPLIEFRAAENWTDQNHGADITFFTVPLGQVGPTSMMNIAPNGFVTLGSGGGSPHPLRVGVDGTNGNGAHVTAGGIWTNGSDRNSKQCFEPIDKAEILRKVATLPISRWQYKGEPDTVRHIGPVAQDFYAAFKTGGDDRSIGTIDADGVALAAIQGLHQIVQEKESEISDLKTRAMERDCEIEELREDVAELKALVKAFAEKAEGGAR